MDRDMENCKKSDGRKSIKSISLISRHSKAGNVDNKDSISIEMDKSQKNKTETIQNLEMIKKDNSSAEIVRSNVFQRTILTVIMILSFSYLISLSNAYLVIFLFYIGLTMNKEVISIAKTAGKFAFESFIVYGFVITIFLYYSANSLENISKNILKYSVMKSNLFFYSYVALVVMFVSSLKKNRLKSQFGLFALIHLTSYLWGVSVNSAINNLYQGKFWLVFPSALVICNDIFAYIVGKWIGRTPLYKLSPKKTTEGFIGGFVFTALFGFAFCYFQLRYKILSDIYSAEVSSVMVLSFTWINFKIPCLYIHGIVFVLMASFIAPFSGFLASGLKRAYKKKDFGSSIPGHGGFTDRFDCQCVMALFTTVYLRTFLHTRLQTLYSTFIYIVNKMSKEEIGVLVDSLNQYLGRP